MECSELLKLFPSLWSRPSDFRKVRMSSATPESGPASYRAALMRLRPDLVTVAALSALVNILMLTAPLYMLQVYDRVLSSGSVATLQGLFLLVVVLYLFLGGFDFLRGRILGRVAHRLDQMLAPRAFGRWMQLAEARRAAPSASDAGPGQGLRDLETLRGFLASPAPLALMDLPWMPFYVIVLFIVHPLLGVLTLIGAAVVIVAAVANQLLAAPGLDRAGRADGDERTFTEQTRRHAELVAALGMGSRLVQQWQQLHDRRLAAAQGASERSEGVGAFSKTFRMFLQSAMLTAAAWLVLGHELSAGMIIASSVISGRALAPIDQTIAQWRTIGRARAAHRRAPKIFADDTPTGRVDLPAPTGRIILSEVTRLAPGVGLAASRSRLIDRISFTLEPGDALGVIGPSAAGKSVLARILTGAWTPDAGEIRFDGATPDQWMPEELGRHIGYLPQHADLLPGSIRDNIARFDPKASDAQVFEAAKIAGVHEMILALPRGYATQSGQGCPLSGGQIQRIGLARAIFGTPKIVVLDEPNAHLDQSGDEALRRAILTMREKGATVIVMAHRPAAIVAVNKVLVLREGQIAAFGPRDEILPTLASATTKGNGPVMVAAAGDKPEAPPPSPERSARVDAVLQAARAAAESSDGIKPANTRSPSPFFAHNRGQRTAE